MMNRRPLIATLLAGAALLPTAAQAQTAQLTPGPQDAASAGTVAAAPALSPEAEPGEIVVTAQKRAENVQQVPINIMAFGQAALAQNSVFSPADLQRIAPSFRSTSSIGTLATRFSIRGIGTFGNSAIEPSVATFIDGIYVPRPASIINSLLDVEAVEVLSGPQGTLFGRNASVGAVTYRTGTPTNEFAVGFKSDVTTGARWRNEGFVNIPLSDTVAVRAAVLADKFGGYWHNDLDNTRFGGVDTFEGRISLKAALAPSLSWTIRLDGQTNTGDGAINTKVLDGTYTAATLARLTTVLGITPETGSYGTHNNSYVRNNKVNDSTWDASSDLSLTTGGDFTFRLLDGYYKWTSHQSDGDTAALPIYVLGRNLTYRSASNSHEFQIISPKDKLLGGRLDFVGGLYYYHEDLGIRADGINGTSFCQTLGTYTTLINGVPGATPAAKIATCQSYGNLASRGDFQQATRSLAAYGQATLQPIDHVFVTGGIRYTDEKKTAVYVGTAYNPTAAATGVGNENTPDLYLTDHRVTWRVNLSYRPTRDLMVFGTASTGFKSGGFNNGTAGVVLGQQRIFQPETVKNYEIGAKTQFLDRRVTFNVTGFRMDIDNFQERSIVSTTSTIRNVGKVRQQGVELSGSIRPMAWLTLDGSATYVDSKIRDYANAPRPTYCPAGLAVATAFCPATASAAAGGYQLQNLAGNRLTYNPKWTIVAGATITGKLTDTGWRWSLSGDANRISSQKMGSQIDNNPVLFQRGYTLLNARLTLFGPHDHYSFAVFGRNLTNKGYCAAEVFQVLSGSLGVNYDNNGDGVADGTLGRCLVGAPRVIGGSFNLKF